MHGFSGGYMNGGRENVVARLSAIDFIVRVRLRQVTDHLVGVHVGGSAAAGLKDVNDKLVIIGAAGHLFGSALDGFGPFGGQMAQFTVYFRRGALEESQRAYESAGQSQSADRKVLNRSRSLRAIQRFCRDAHLTHSVPLNAKLLGHGGPP